MVIVLEQKNFFKEFLSQLVGKKVSNEVEQLIELVFERKKMLEKIRENIKIERVEKMDIQKIKNLLIFGVDSGSNGINLEGFYLSFMTAFSFPTSSSAEPLMTGNIKRIFGEEDPSRRVRVCREMLMFSLAEKTIRDFSPDYIFIDGPLVLNDWLIPTISDSKSYELEFKGCIDSLNSLLKVAKMNGTKVIGIVKRIYSRTVVDTMSKQLTDSLLLNPIMSIGDATLSNQIRDRAILKKYRVTKRFYSFFLKSGTRTSVIRVEFPEWCIESEKEIKSIVYALSDIKTGVPIPILEADSLTKVSNTYLNMIYMRYFTKFLERIKKERFGEQELDIVLPKYGEVIF